MHEKNYGRGYDWSFCIHSIKLIYKNINSILKSSLFLLEILRTGFSFHTNRWQMIRWVMRECVKQNKITIQCSCYVTLVSTLSSPIISFSPPSSDFLLLTTHVIALPFRSECIFFFLSLHTLHLFFCWTEVTQPVRNMPGIFLCPSSPSLSTDTLYLPGSSSVGRGHCSTPRAATSPLLPSIYSDSALLRKSVSFTEDLLLAASGIVGLLCVIRSWCLWSLFWTALFKINLTCFIRDINSTCMLLLSLWNNTTDWVIPRVLLSQHVVWCTCKTPSNFTLSPLFVPK